MGELSSLPAVIYGIPVDDLDMDAALNRLEALVHVGRERTKTHQVVTVNTDFIVKAVGDPDLRSLLQKADLVTADGMPVVWASRLLGVPLQGRVAGSDLVPALAERAAQKGLSLYFYGARLGVAAAAAESLRSRWPELKIVGVESPPYREDLHTDQAALDRIRAAAPDILLVALGNPKQEKWIAKYAGELGVPVMMGVGASLDFIAGSVQRAPRWMQKSGLEWCYRLIQEPARLWKRYVVDLVVFSVLLLRQWKTFWLAHRPAKPSVESVSSPIPFLSVQGKLSGGRAKALVEKGSSLFLPQTPLLIDLRGLTGIDSAGLGALVGLAKQARLQGSQPVLISAPPYLTSILKEQWLDQFFLVFESMEAALGSDGTSIKEPVGDAAGD
jgi:N-acetylglucosaminyldiphosphoundecaprenol N-acetyl-beta-D-mannosaminyltransferase